VALVSAIGLVPACRVEQRIPARPPQAALATAGPFRGAAIDTAGGLLPVPPDSEIPRGEMGRAIRRGKALMASTGDSLPGSVGSGLRCFSCHLRDGTQMRAFPLVGVYARFPQYRSRNDLVNLLEDRINDCFERSVNGRAIPRDGRDMRDLVAWMAWISRGVPPPGEVPGAGLGRIAPFAGDTARGRAVFGQICIRCHGPDGHGTSLAPPLWGPRSFNIGAGMARLQTAAAFIRHNMPFDRAVTLTDQQAFDVAAYLVSRPRPDFARKALDWPNGDPPPDAAYKTRAGRKDGKAQ
jgi:thiosulfate dehydrogenase